MLDWIRVKQEHITSEFTDAQVGSLVRFQLLVARLGRRPTDKELFNETSKRTVASLEIVLSSFGVDLNLVASKVLERTDKIKKRKKYNIESANKSKVKKVKKVSNECKVEYTPKSVKEAVPKPEFKTKSFIKPTLEEVKKHIEEAHLNVDADIWYDRCEAVGWTVSGKSPMKSWRAALSYWSRSSNPQKRIVYFDPAPEDIFLKVRETFPENRKGIESKCRELFRDYVVKSGEWEEFELAFDNYTKTDDVKNGFIMYFSNWIPLWRNNL